MEELIAIGRCGSKHTGGFKRDKSLKAISSDDLNI